MDKMSIIGIILGVFAVGMGMVLKGIPIESLLNPAAFLIIVVGTMASVLIAFPTRVIKNIPSLFKIIFTDKQEIDIKELIDVFIRWAEQTRRECLLSLETNMEEVEDPFLKSGLQMSVDGQNPDFIRDVLMEKIVAMEKDRKSRSLNSSHVAIS